MAGNSTATSCAFLRGWWANHAQRTRMPPRRHGLRAGLGRGDARAPHRRGCARCMRLRCVAGRCLGNRRVDGILAGVCGAVSEHTKELWRICESLSGADYTHVTSEGFDNVAVFRKPADARRAVACVNACGGFATEVLERRVAEGRGIVAEIIAQRDELLAALQATRGQWIHSINANQCLAAITQVESSQ